MKNQQKEHGSVAESARLKELIKALGMTQNKFARSIGISGQHISLIVRKERGITEDFANRIARYHNSVEADWLLTGEGELFKKDVFVEVDPEKVELKREIDRLKDELRREREARLHSDERGERYLSLLEKAVRKGDE